jgi:hypothetical protein
MKKIKGPDIEGGAGQIDTAGRCCGDAHLWCAET